MTVTQNTRTESVLTPDDPAEIVRFGQQAVLDALRVEMVALTTFVTDLTTPHGTSPLSPQERARRTRADDAEAIFDNMPV
jgi:hypothetical protein